jgi:hypothetical protein
MKSRRQIGGVRVLVTTILNVVKSIILLTTLLSFIVLIVLFFYFLFTGMYIKCFLSLMALYIFIILNEKV